MSQNPASTSNARCAELWPHWRRQLRCCHSIVHHFHAGSEAFGLVLHLLQDRRLYGVLVHVITTTNERPQCRRTGYHPMHPAPALKESCRSRSHQLTRSLGPTPKDVLSRYTTLTGKSNCLPAWSFGLRLTTSFTTEYDENTINGFLEGMRNRDIPLAVFHYDAFWMRPFHW